MIWRLFHRRGVPYYLARHYWWAYLARPMVWFFDHQWIINLILFGQYRRLMRATLERLRPSAPGRVLQLTNVYGELTPKLWRKVRPGQLHLMDVARVQLEQTRGKLARRVPDTASPVSLVQMDAERLAYANNSFDTVVVFFLLHELPADARERVLAEALRVLRPGGQLLVTDYGALRDEHLLHRNPWLRGLIGRLEPFLPAFWREDLEQGVINAARAQRKSAMSVDTESVFGGFYRVVDYRVAPVRLERDLEYACETERETGLAVEPA
jgi:ubiquinone/menaquinone biosynthesis C-methylase UbiE